ncbi:hypothetical protein ACU8KH_05164 [Lachancea thermotolerans]
MGALVRDKTYKHFSANATCYCLKFDIPGYIQDTTPLLVEACQNSKITTKPYKGTEKAKPGYLVTLFIIASCYVSNKRCSSICCSRIVVSWTEITMELFLDQTALQIFAVFISVVSYAC